MHSHFYNNNNNNKNNKCGLFSLILLSEFSAGHGKGASFYFFIPCIPCTPNNTSLNHGLLQSNTSLPSSNDNNNNNRKQSFTRPIITQESQNIDKTYSSRRDPHYNLNVLIVEVITFFRAIVSLFLWTVSTIAILNTNDKSTFQIIYTYRVMCRITKSINSSFSDFWAELDVKQK
jgi:hypothetical protein